METTKIAERLIRRTSTLAAQTRHGSRAEAKVPESKTDSSGNAEISLESQLSEAKRMLDPILPTWLTIDKSKSQPCLKFIVQTQQKVKQHLFKVNNKKLYFLDLINGNLCIKDDIEFYSPHEAIQRISLYHGLNRESVSLMESGGNVEITPEKLHQIFYERYFKDLA